MRCWGILLVFVSLGCAAAELPWAPFYWDGDKKDGLFVPLKFDNLPTTYLMQLDTGTPQTVFYQVPMRQLEGSLGVVEGSNAPLTIPLSIAGYHYDDFVKADYGLHVWNNFGDPIDPKDEHPQLGTVGVDVFVHHVVVLDFPHRRIAMLDEGQTLPTDLVAKAVFLPVQFDKAHDWKIFLPLNISGKDYPDDFFYDSGSSETQLEAVKMTWQELTGLTGNEKGLDTFTSLDWGQQDLFAKAPIKGQLTIGPVKLDRPLAVTMLRGRPQGDLSNANYHVLGLIGNAPFYDKYLLIIDLPHKRLGILQSD